MSDTQELSDSEIERMAAEYIAADWEPDRYYRDMNLVAFARALLARASVPTEAQTSELEDMRARKDAAYEERNRVVAALAKVFPSGVARTAIEGWSEDWHGCVYIDLPTGQASWHFHDSQAHLFAGLPPYTKPWDGHSTEEKYRRVAALAASPPQSAPDGGDARDGASSDETKEIERG